MFAGALFIQLSTGWNMYLSVIVLLVITTLYTMLGKYHVLYRKSTSGGTEYIVCLVLV